MTKLDLTKPVQTRNGLSVRILCHDFVSPLSIVYAVKNNDCSEFLSSCYPDGRVTLDHTTQRDLINVPPKPVKYFVNVYRHTNGITVGAANPDKPINTTADNFIKTIEFEV